MSPNSLSRGEKSSDALLDWLLNYEWLGDPFGAHTLAIWNCRWGWGVGNECPRQWMNFWLTGDMNWEIHFSPLIRRKTVLKQRSLYNLWKDDPMRSHYQLQLTPTVATVASPVMHPIMSVLLSSLTHSHSSGNTLANKLAHQLFL